MKSVEELTERWGASMDPLVSICCITYNHEKYIAQALDSFFMQETDFPFEIVIHDDASTDNTANIIRKYEKQYPGIINPIYQTENQKSKYKSGMNPRFNYPRAKGKYIALCDGDDYWIDPLKLQKQVDFLNKHADFGLVYTQAQVFDQNKNEFSAEIHGRAIIGNSLLYFNPIPTGSVMLRSSLVNRYMVDFGNVMLSWKMGDYPLWLWFYYNSKIYFLREASMVWRILQESASHFVNPERKIEFKFNTFCIAKSFAKVNEDNNSYLEFIGKKSLQIYFSTIKLNMDSTKSVFKRLNVNDLGGSYKVVLYFMEICGIKYIIMYLYKYLWKNKHK